MNFRTLLWMVLFILSFQLPAFAGEKAKIKLGDDLLLSQYHHLVDGKNIGLVTNQTGVNSDGKRMVDVLFEYPGAHLKAIYAPEHGLDGKAKAGEYVESYKDPRLGIPVYSLYGKTRMPTEEMLKEIDVLIFDIQDIGARSYTYISTLNYCMKAAKNFNKQLIVLDRPNPLGGEIVEGPVLEDAYQSFVGIDNLPMAHGMTVGELALFFNRKIGADVSVVPMEGYTRNMIFQDTGLSWIPSSPNIPDLHSVMGYMATGLGEGTGIVQRDKFKWIGGKGIDSEKYAHLLNQAGLPGVHFIPENSGDLGGVRLKIVDPRSFNPAKTGIYALTYAYSLGTFKIPESAGQDPVMFDKIMGTNKIGQYLKRGLSPQEIEAAYAGDLNRFKAERKKYLLYGNSPVQEDPAATKRINMGGGLIIHKKSYVPLKPVLSELGYAVSWESAAKQVYAVKPDKTIVIDTRTSPMKIFVNGSLVESREIIPEVIGGSTYIPAQFIPWIEKSKQQTVGNTIQIKTEGLEIMVAIPASTNPSDKKTGPAGTSRGKTAYLTFDDGPSELTPKVLDILKANQVKATFFVVGKNIKGNESILKRAAAEGHAIGGHTYSHRYDSIYKNIDAFFKDLAQGQKAIEQVIGQKTVIFRFPGGSNNSVSKKAQDPALYRSGKWIMHDLVAEAVKRGYRYFDWNVSTGDASSSGYTAKSAYLRVKEGIKNKNQVIILSHDSSSKENTVKALPKIIQLLKAEGYSFGVLDDKVEGYAFLK